MQPWPCYVDQLRTIPYMDAVHAEWLREYAEDAGSILEWGCGGSTIWLAQIAKGKVTSIEHDPIWHGRVQKVLKALEEAGVVSNRPEVWLQSDKAAYCDQGEHNKQRGLDPYDLAFIDGYAPWRLDCLFACPRCVKPGGHIFMHDSQRHIGKGGIPPNTCLDEFVRNNCIRSESRIDSIGVGMWHAQLKG